MRSETAQSKKLKVRVYRATRNDYVQEKKAELALTKKQSRRLTTLLCSCFYEFKIVNAQKSNSSFLSAGCLIIYLSKITSNEGRTKRISRIAQSEPMPSVVRLLATAPDINLPQIRVTRTMRSDEVKIE